MKTVAKLFGTLFVVARGANTLTGTHTFEIRNDNKPAECSIEQCLNWELHNTECAAAAAEGCGYAYDLVISGALTDSDLCVFPGPPTQTETPLWLKLDLSPALPVGLADWFHGCVHQSGALVFHTTYSNPDPSLLLTGYGSPSLECDGSVDSGDLGWLAEWTGGTRRIEVGRGATFLDALFKGKYTLLLNSTVGGLTEASVGSITGFTAEDWHMYCSATNVGTLPPVSDFRGGDLSLADVAGSCVDGCADKGSVAGVEACVAAAPAGCDFSASYTYSGGGSIRIVDVCETDDQRRVSKQLIFPSDLGDNTNIEGSLFLDIGSLPYEGCQIEVSLLSGKLDLDGPNCGLDNAQVASSNSIGIGPTIRTMEVTQLPDNFVGVAVSADKDWRLCGGAINAMRAESLTSTFHIISKADPSDSGVPTALTLAGVSFASWTLLF
eukprot:Gregarina_sp_Pseudo_9__892@NODE_1570_length_1488_cov_7_926156_g1457_i0_p1_GENE_NODE_1570_length_1488_cov_7_926156_g1457_i0NODE_1570_length_1488_cov_7_926156_g1457_i0_p1_ORF_typecomplete_len438_score77_39_NODE_1570_length_1488_cov_7_926156_g1457_i0351348